MRMLIVPGLILLAALPACADFSYTVTRKSSAGESTAKQFFKGQKMMTDDKDTAVILDFDAKTVTNINKVRQSYTVIPFTQVTAAAGIAQAKVDVKDTGQTKTINGYSAHQILMTMNVNSQAAPQGSMQLQIEMEWWLSNDVPGGSEAKAFYQRNGENFPWAALTSAMGPAASSIAEGMRQVMKSGGVPVLQITRSKMVGGPSMSAAQQAQMEQARARMQQMAQSGGPAAAAAQQALQRMNAAGGGGASETTMESSGFSTASIPDSTFAIPAGFLKK